MRSMTFNIIYTPGTVQQLSFLVYSLLKWSNDCTFRLVANGVGADEAQLLQALCTGNPRLAYAALPTRKLLTHGEALNDLQAQNQDDYFCFMDSDIYAVAEFMPAFGPLVESYSGLFSAMPLRFPQTGLTLPKDKAFMAGPYTHTQAQLCLGTTFFAIYNNQAITEVRRATGIDFHKYRWEEIPAIYQGQLQALGLQHQLYDTAKLLNLVLHIHGHALHYQPCPALRHIEAVSRLHVIQHQAWWRQLRVLSGRWRRKLCGQKVELTYDEALPYLSQLLWALAHHQSPPPLPAMIMNGSNSWVMQTRQELLALHAEFPNGPG